MTMENATELLKKFEQYVVDGAGPITNPENEVLLAGFENAINQGTYDVIIRTAARLPKDYLRGFDGLQQLYDRAYLLSSAIDGTEPENTDGDQVMDRPFDPEKIKIQIRTLSLDTIIKRINRNALDLMPDFQRKAGIWKDDAQSRLIESIIVRMPLPAFYIDGADENRWVVVDGLQRLTSLKRFIIDKKLKLTGLEFLKSYEGKGFDELPATFQQRIEETQVTVYLIESGTPSEVKFNVFKRINTGGVPLSPQEIRHALNQGKSTKLLQGLAESSEFQIATSYGVQNDRMSDRECVIRFLAFKRTSYTTYNYQDLDGFLSDQMAEINRLSDLQIDELRVAFARTMKVAYDLFGNEAFRKLYADNQRRTPVNKPLFEAWSVALDKLNDTELAILKNHKVKLRDKFKELMNTRDFDQAITQGTGSISKIKARFSGIERIIKEVLEDTESA